MPPHDPRFAAERFILKDSKIIEGAPWLQRPTKTRGCLHRNGIWHENYRSRPNRRSTMCLKVSYLDFGIQKQQLISITKWLTFLLIGLGVSVLVDLTGSLSTLGFLSSVVPVVSDNLCGYPTWSNAYIGIAMATTCKLLFSSPTISFLLKLPQPDIFYPNTNPSLNSPNYASSGSGAVILKEFTSPTHNLPPPSWLAKLRSMLFGLDFNRLDINRPFVILEDNLQEGECWEFSGPAGQVGIRLSKPIRLSGCAFDSPAPHILSNSSFSRTPYNMTLWAVMDESVVGKFSPLERLLLDSSSGSKGTRVGKTLTPILTIAFDPQRYKTKQVFIPAQGIAQAIEVEDVILEVHGNHGGKTTCIYWIGVYGL